MTNPDPQHSNPDPQHSNPEAALGGADAVEKTTYVVGRGTDPGARSDGNATAHPPAGSGPNYLAWGVGAIVAFVAIAYLAAMFG